MANQVYLQLLFLLLCPSSIVVGTSEGWQDLGPWVHSLTEASFAKDSKQGGPSQFQDFQPKNAAQRRRIEEKKTEMQAIWLAQAGYDVSHGVQGPHVLEEHRRDLAEARGDGVDIGFQPSRIPTLAESKRLGQSKTLRAGRVEENLSIQSGRTGGQGGGGVMQLESIFQPSPFDQNYDGRARVSSEIEKNAFLATRYYPEQEVAFDKSGKQEAQHRKKHLQPPQQPGNYLLYPKRPKYLLADPAHHVYLR